MQLLKSIIHHADAVQKQFLVPKLAQDDSKQSKSNNLFGSDDFAEVNNKCYQRWHDILQDGLVPLSVRALNLLEKTEPVSMTRDDEEEAYFSTLEGMDEEIQVMAILARAAALNDVENNAEEVIEDNGGDMEMEQINCAMKCIAILLFHIVMESSSVESSESMTNNGASSDTANQTTVPGYDGRVRHVLKMACVDMLSRAIMSSVNAYDKKRAQGTTDDDMNHSQQTPNCDFGDNWGIQKIKSFLDIEDLGRDAVFGTPWKPSSESKENTSLENVSIEGIALEEKTSESVIEDEHLSVELGDEQSPIAGQIPQVCEEDIDNTMAQTRMECFEIESGECFDNHEVDISNYDDEKCPSQI